VSFGKLCRRIPLTFHQPNEDITTNYELSFGIYAKAKLKKSNNVNLWLGVRLVPLSLSLISISPGSDIFLLLKANVMVEYPIPEALQLLQDNRKGAEQKMADTEKTLDFVQDQITTVQVSMARIHNYDIAQKRAAGALPK